MIARILTVFGSLLCLAAPAWAAQCGGNFNNFLSQMARDAQAQGISRAVIAQSFNGLTPDEAVLRFDRRQAHAFRREGNFEAFIKTRVGTARVNRAAKLMRKNAALLNRIERQYGVPKELLMAIWSMETDNIVQRGDLPPSQMVGAFAGEIGQTQFLPSSYIKYGVDYDGNGHVDLRHSVPDVLASTANLLKMNGWQAGQPYHMGTANFDVMREWNRSEIYRRALVLFAERLGGHP
jgi:membrane-bound lytic murein transglycosylase B